jgi:hypothetical protein
VSVPLGALLDTEVPGDVPRDRWRRPLIHVLSDTLEPYTRVSTVAGWLSDGHGLGIWKLRHAALSIARHPDVAGLIAPLAYGDAALDEAIEAACERSVAMVEARHHGTAMHAWAEKHAGDPAREWVPERMRPDIEAYDERLGRAGLVLLESEVFVVNDELRVAGTLDSLLLDTETGFAVVGDEKTGKLSPLSVSAQLAMYAGGQRYDPLTGVRTPLSLRLDTERALVIHLPKGEGRCDLYSIDLERARASARVALAVGLARKEEKSILSQW